MSTAAFETLPWLAVWWGVVSKNYTGLSPTLGHLWRSWDSSDFKYQASWFYHNSFLPPYLWGFEMRKQLWGNTRRTGSMVVAVLLFRDILRPHKLGLFQSLLPLNFRAPGVTIGIYLHGDGHMALWLFSWHSILRDDSPPPPRGGGSGVSPESLLLTWRIYPAGCWQCSLVLALCSVT